MLRWAVRCSALHGSLAPDLHLEDPQTQLTTVLAAPAALRRDIGLVGLQCDLSDDAVEWHVDRKVVVQHANHRGGVACREDQTGAARKVLPRRLALDVKDHAGNPRSDLQLAAFAQPAPLRAGPRVEFRLVPAGPEPEDRPLGRRVELLDRDASWCRRRDFDGNVLWPIARAARWLKEGQERPGRDHQWGGSASRRCREALSVAERQAQVGGMRFEIATADRDPSH